MSRLPQLHRDLLLFQECIIIQPINARQNKDENKTAQICCSAAFPRSSSTLHVLGAVLFHPPSFLSPSHPTVRLVAASTVAWDCIGPQNLHLHICAAVFAYFTKTMPIHILHLHKSAWLCGKRAKMASLHCSWCVRKGKQQQRLLIRTFPARVTPRFTLRYDLTFSRQSGQLCDIVIVPSTL